MAMARGLRAIASPGTTAVFRNTSPTMMSKLARALLIALPLVAAGVAAQAPAPAADTPTAPATATAPDGSKPYKVVDGYKVDAFTMTGFRTWRAAACDRCHGAEQQGLVGPSLVNSLKVLTKEDFVKTVRDGRLEKGMVSFKENQTVMSNIDALYAYLKGRSDGAITRARVEPMEAGAGS
jgi:mono/diheme cytochrome c family protein